MTANQARKVNPLAHASTARPDALPARAHERQRALRGVAIDSVGAALPDRVVTNAEIAELLGVDEHWIVKRTGVRERRWAQPGESMADLVEVAARQALDRAGLDPADLDLVLVATESYDEMLPGCSPVIADRLGAELSASADIHAACTGLLTAMDLAAAQIETGRADNALVIGAEMVSKFLDLTDRMTVPLMADGAGALVLSAREGASRVGPSVFRADGALWNLAYVPRTDYRFRMAGGDTFQFAVQSLADVTREVLERAGLTIDDIDVFAYHQANGRILRAVGAKLGLDADKVLSVVEWIGNPSAASIPISLDHAIGEGRLEDGDRVLMAAIGGGAIWGACLVEWGG